MHDSSFIFLNSLQKTWRTVEDNGGYPPPLIIYISNAYVMRGGY